LLHKLLLILEHNQLRLLVLVLTGTLIAGMLEMIGIGAIPAFVGLLVEPDKLLAGLPKNAFSGWIRDTNLNTLILYGAVLLACFFLLKNLYLAALIYVETKLAAGITASVSNRLFRSYLYTSYSFHLQRNPAKFVRNLTEESVDSVEFIKGGMHLMREGLVLAVVFVLLILVDPLVSLSVFSVAALVSGGFYLAVRRALTRRGQLSQEHWGRQVQIINQAMGAIKDIKILGRELHLMNMFNTEVESSQRQDTFYLFVSAMPKLFLEVLSVTGLVLVVGAFVLLGRPVQSMLPVLALFGVVVVRLVPALTTINMSLADIRYKRPAFDVVCGDLETLETPIVNRARNGDQSELKRFMDAIRLEHIHYRYPGASAEALQGISLKINAGEAVAFIGSSGVGKSTLIDVLLGLLVPTSGQVRVDGRDIQEDLPAWQRQIGYVPQDIYLTDDCIRRNIAFGMADEEIDEETLAHAVQISQLEGFVQSLPEGLSTLVGNRGIRLSGGQRQRIGIARALYHDPTVLVMDEATSALDNETEREVIDAIRRLRGNRTIIMIAHRLTTVKECDSLFLLEAGKLKDQASFEELVKRHKTLHGLTPVIGGNHAMLNPVS
jgi:ATP-binding cassette, subfamily B, bacterial PglK